MKHYDISPELSPQIAVFPGDEAFKQRVSYHVDKGHLITLSSIQSTLHVGAHADAPIHYAKNGSDIAKRSLDFYMGRAQVISIKKKPNQRIQVSDLESIKILAPRVLLKTQSFPDPNNWNGDFVSCSAPAIEYLASRGVKLVGIDTPSIDLADCKKLESHQVIAKHNMAILEGLVLSEVPDGVYTLFALPLKIKDGDASPVRAILFEKDLGLD